jgi:hypothetical protein
MAGSVDIENPADKDTVEMRYFSMNQPFAALLTNGCKTLETRHGTMFATFAEGTQMLLHVGPTQTTHIEVVKSGGLDDEQIAELKYLPQGYGRGNAVAIVELGKTYETSLEERCDPDFQRRVAAYGADSGRVVTEIKRVSYLKEPIKMPGQGGVFKVQIDPEVIPDRWSVPWNEVADLYTSISGCILFQFAVDLNLLQITAMPSSFRYRFAGTARSLLPSIYHDQLEIS